jgi:tripartite-type tricarboxylate transporter receptor subunit TctC
MIRKFIAGSILIGAFCAPALAQDTYPSDTVRFVLGFSPGGGTDTVARVMADALSKSWGQSVVVENKVGAGGLIAAQSVAEAAPDGLTLLFDSASYAIRPALNQALPYKPKEAFVPVSLVASSPYVLVVSPNVEADSVEDLIALAKEKPGELTYASSGVGSALHLASALFAELAGIDIVHVPYQGTAGIPDLLAGRVTMGFVGLPQSLSLIEAGQLRALAVTTPERAAALPDVPTMQEAGVSGYATEGWYGLFAPAKTPAAVVDKLAADVAIAMGNATVVDAISKQGLVPLGTAPAEFGPFVDEELQKWNDVVSSAGITVE